MKAAQSRMFIKRIDKIRSKAHKTAYIKGYQATMCGHGVRRCAYKKKAGGIGYRNLWLIGFKDAASDIVPEPKDKGETDGHGHGRNRQESSGADETEVSK